LITGLVEYWLSVIFGFMARLQKEFWGNPHLAKQKAASLVLKKYHFVVVFWGL
jgi:hypothetical protein